MKILVCMSVVPDTTTKITFKENNTKFNSEGVQYIINPYDELSLTRALEITEVSGGTVTVINVGKDTEPVIRKALAIGAHDAIRIDLEPTDASMVAEAIAHVARGKNFDLILTGRESIDFNGGLVGGLIAAHLGHPFINIATSLNLENSNIRASRDIDGGREDLLCPLPCVVSAQKDLCEPRIPNMRGIMAARTKPLEVVSADITTSKVSFDTYELPAPKSGVKLISPENAGELIDLLHNEKKVI